MQPCKTDALLLHIISSELVAIKGALLIIHGYIEWRKEEEKSTKMMYKLTDYTQDTKVKPASVT